jgi:hypothetical protein
MVNSVGEGQDKKEGTGIQTPGAKFNEIYDHLQPVHIYGKVVDQNGSAVVGADIKVDWESADFLVGTLGGGGQTLLRSDGTGAWEFTIEKPHRAFVHEVIVPGYEYTTRYNQQIPRPAVSLDTELRHRESATEVSAWEKLESRGHRMAQDRRCG